MRRRRPSVHLLAASALAAGLLALGACTLPRARDVEVRPIRIRVVDAATRQPLGGIPVAYALQAMVMRQVLGIFRAPIEPDVGPRLVHKARGVTDANGELELRAGKLRLKGNERLYAAFVLVNLGVDTSDRTAQAALDAELAGCQRLPDTCPRDRADDVDVALKLIQEFEDDRARVLLNPDGRHRGAVLITEPPDAHREFYRDWTTPRDRFRVRFEFAPLTGKAETLVVELEPGS